ncbi:MAG: hypothetical protein ABUS79_13345 [Pseudomonadota bacterium]
MIRSAFRLVVMAALLLDTARGDARAAAPPPSPSMHVDIRGAVAHVTVTRALTCAHPSGAAGAAGAAAAPAAQEQAGDTVVDLALPERSVLLGVEVSDGGRYQETKPIDITKAREAYLESLRALGLAGTKLAFEDEVGFRVRVGCRQETINSYNRLRYHFSVLLEASGDRARIAFPASPELSPVPVRVDVRVHPGAAVSEISIAGASHPVRAGAESSASEIVSTRARWLISLDRARAGMNRADGGRLTGLASIAAPKAGPRIVAYALGAVPGPARPLPDRVLFLVDRSRSVGAGGLEAERNLARRLLESMPPATRFDALFFDRGQKRLFAVPRPATREAITALEDEMVTSRLGNGTDLVGVLRATGDLIRRESSNFAPRLLLIVLSDGAIGHPTVAADDASLIGPTPGVALTTAAISIRPNDDPPVSVDERRFLRRLVAAIPAGGIERAIRTADITDAVPAILNGLRAGGDVHAVEIAARGPGADGRGASKGKRVDGVADAIAPGDGATGIATVPPGKLTLGHHGQSRPAEFQPTQVEPSWLAPFLKVLPDARLLVSPALAVLVEPVFHPPPPSPAVKYGPSGYMERSVVRDALSLAFTPRARACYLNRSARTPADRDLTGRVRLALDLVRGEVGGARVESSTLGRPAIENCLRDAAYALDVPRAYRNDEPVTAVLNLIFRPRNPERRAGGLENPSIANEIDLMVEAALKESPEAEPDASSAKIAPTDAGPPADR